MTAEEEADEKDFQRLVEELNEKRGKEANGARGHINGHKAQPEQEEVPLPQPIPAREFMAMPAAVPEFLVENLIKRYGLNAFAGVSHSGKTALAISAIVEAARNGFRVVLFEEEGEVYEIQHKLRLSGLTDELADRVAILHGSSIDLNKDSWRAHFEVILSQYDLAVLDSFSDVQSSNAMDQVQMDEFFKWLRDCNRRQKKTVLVLMHSPKSVVRLKDEPRLADIFGSQTIGAKLDGGFVICDYKPPKSEYQEEELAEDAPNPFKEVWNVKLRGFTRVPPRIARIDSALTGDSDRYGKPRDVGVWKWEPMTPAKKRLDDKVVAAAAIVLEALKAFGRQPNRSELYKKMAPDKGTRGTRPKKQLFYLAMTHLQRTHSIRVNLDKSIEAYASGSQVPSGSHQVPEPTTTPQEVPGSRVPYLRSREPRNRELELAASTADSDVDEVPGSVDIPDDVRLFGPDVEL